MVKHTLEAFINDSEGAGFRIICNNSTACGDIEGYAGCIYTDQFANFNTNMISWHGNEIVFGRIELKGKVEDPCGAAEAWLTNAKEPVSPTESTTPISSQ